MGGRGVPVSGDLKTSYQILFSWLPYDMAENVVKAVLVVPQSIFFRGGKPRKDEIKEFDQDCLVS